MEAATAPSFAAEQPAVTATRYSRITLALVGASGILSFGTYTNGADFVLLYVPPATNLLALTLLQLFVVVALAPIVSLGDTLPVLPRMVVSTVGVGVCMCCTLALPAISSESAASAILCVCTIGMGVGNGVLQATSAGLAGAGGPELLTAQASGVGIANLLMSAFRVVFKLAMPGEIELSYTWFVGAHVAISALIVLNYIVGAKRDPYLSAVLLRRAESASAAKLNAKLQLQQQQHHQQQSEKAKATPVWTAPTSANAIALEGLGDTAASAASATAATATAAAHDSSASTESVWVSIRGTGHYGIGQVSALGVALTVFPGFAFQQPSTFGLAESWLPVLATALFNLGDCATRILNAILPGMARPSALKHALLAVANCAVAAGLVASCLLRWSDAIVLAFHFALAATSSWQIAVCFVGADARAAARGVPGAVRERTGTVMQGLVLTGVLLGLALSTVVAEARAS